MINKVNLSIITLFTVLIAYLYLDFLGFAIWVVSGQSPASDYYLGSVTASFLKLFIN